MRHPCVHAGHATETFSDPRRPVSHEDEQVALVTARDAQRVVEVGRLEHALGRGGCRYPEPADAKAQELHVHSSPVVPRREPGTNHVFEEPEQHPLLVLRRELTGIDRLQDPLVARPERARPSRAQDIVGGGVDEAPAAEGSVAVQRGTDSVRARYRL